MKKYFQKFPHIKLLIKYFFIFRIYQNILTKFPKNKKAIEGIKVLSGRATIKKAFSKEPPEDQLQSLINLYTQAQYQEALDKATTLLKAFSNSVILSISAVCSGVSDTPCPILPTL